jgi:hypothetical protein
MEYRQICGLVLVTSLAATGAQAADRNWNLAGQALKITTPCARQVTIEPAANLRDAVEVQANASRQEEIDRLTVTGGSTATIDKNTSSCGGWTSSKPTLILTIRVPAGMPLRIEEGASADYQIGAVGGPLDLALAGSGDVKAANANQLRALLSGSGDVAIGQLAGKLEAKASGSGNLTVNAGTVGPVKAILSGSGNLTLPAIGALELLTTGSGDTKVQSLAGDVEVQTSGSGNLAVGQVQAGSVKLQATGSSDIKFGGGSINSLMIMASGSRDIEIDAAVTDATISSSGSSSVRIPKVSGKLVQNSSGSGRLSINH